MSYPEPNDSWYEPDDLPAPPDDMTCQDCNHFRNPPGDNDYGWCDSWDDWAEKEQLVCETGCADWDLI